MGKVLERKQAQRAHAVVDESPGFLGSWVPQVLEDTVSWRVQEFHVKGPGAEYCKLHGKIFRALNDRVASLGMGVHGGIVSHL